MRATSGLAVFACKTRGHGPLPQKTPLPPTMRTIQ